MHKNGPKKLNLQGRDRIGQQINLFAANAAKFRAAIKLRPQFLMALGKD